MLRSFPRPHLKPVALTLMACLSIVAGRADWPLPPASLSLDSLLGHQHSAGNWQIVGDLLGDPRNETHFTTAAGSTILVNAATESGAESLATPWAHGDLELEFQFLLPRGSVSGVLLQGRYLIELRADMDRKGRMSGTAVGPEENEDRAPVAPAGRAPGLWQRLQITFEAPRFDAGGTKVRPARLRSVTLNGFLIHDRVELAGPSRGADLGQEAPMGPLVFPGGPNPLAVRALKVKRAGDEQISVGDLHYSFHQGDYRQIGAYDSAVPTRTGPLNALDLASINPSGRFGLVITGSLNVPQDGDYAFKIESGGASRMLIGDRPAVTSVSGTTHSHAVRLPAGTHPFRLDMIHLSKYPPTLEIQGEGPGILAHLLTVPAPEDAPGTDVPNAPNWKPRQIFVEVEDRVRVQRGFVPFGSRKRVYTVSVGLPEGISYAYDLQAGNLLNLWRGDFLDVTDMWEWRGVAQLAKAAGPSLTLPGKPGIALFEFRAPASWPTEPEALWSPQGYHLEANGQPVFIARLADMEIRDRIAPATHDRGLTRTLHFKGSLPDWPAWVLLAESHHISAQPDNKGWVIGDREWYLDWPAENELQPVLRSFEGGMQLAVPLVRARPELPITYSIIW